MQFNAVFLALASAIAVSAAPQTPGDVNLAVINATCSTVLPCLPSLTCVYPWNPSNMTGQSGTCMTPFQANRTASLGQRCGSSIAYTCLPGLKCSFPLSTNIPGITVDGNNVFISSVGNGVTVFNSGGVSDVPIVGKIGTCEPLDGNWTNATSSNTSKIRGNDAMRGASSALSAVAASALIAALFSVL